MTPRSRLKRQQKVDSERKARSLKKKAEKRHREKEEKQAAEKEEKEQMELVRVENETVRIQAVLGAMKEHGFKTVWQFCETFLATKHPQLSSQVTQLIRDHHPEIQHALARRDPVQHSELAIETVKGVIQSEIAALAELLRRQEKTAVSDILDAFSETGLESGLASAASIEETAPTLVEMLRESVLSKAKLAIIEEGKDLRRDHNIVIYTICCMLAFTRKEKASNLQLVIGLYLLASGARKNLVDVLAHAGLTLSYRSIIRQVKNLSEEATANIVRIFREQMCGIVWDNLNIAFRVGEQRTNNQDHFDNGTTATLLTLFCPIMKDSVQWGTLPFYWKDKRRTRAPMYELNIDVLFPKPEHTAQLRNSCLWQLRRMATEHIPGLKGMKNHIGTAPEVHPIPLHKTEQYPLPAMHIDESSINGTIRVIEEIILRVLKITPEEMKEHGLLFVDGDLLTLMLLDKVEAARRDDKDILEGLQFTIRRFGLFHCMMAGCRLVLYQYWGKLNAELCASLWKENLVANRKPMKAGWKTDKHPPWQTSHELLHISAAAHIQDAFHTYLNVENLEEWAKGVSPEEFMQVSEQVFERSFTSQAVHSIRRLDQEQRDYFYEHTLLYNRDVLVYLEYCDAIRTGDIGRVLNVLRVWMIMMRGENRMPKYADMIFETLTRLEEWAPRLCELFLNNWLVNLSGKPNGWKEVDLLQEHQNYWNKSVYNAKGSNKSWDWLSMISTCVYILRDAMRTVHEAFDITPSGNRHSSPNMAKEIALIAEYLHTEKLHTYISGRGINDGSAMEPPTDLLVMGAMYPNTRWAFHTFVPDLRKAAYATSMDTEVPEEPLEEGEESGLDSGGGEMEKENEEEEEEAADEEFYVEQEDLEADPEGFEGMHDQLLDVARGIAQALHDIY
ncbi:hypothetical protein M422DRAFT_171500 [Sphaerobolus stellatus SS14]|uniref:DUF6589 domain-containing protein n=1 Tax=Sphaerobolus stellatus (strain SS14) TaxID=990650 RepID=A0A0C9VK88_SPHS4|nr:hypothetical protein M422DRAFT_171500 [Sphaerobolus stellatus SS14]